MCKGIRCPNELGIYSILKLRYLQNQNKFWEFMLNRWKRKMTIEKPFWHMMLHSPDQLVRQSLNMNT
jgi:hypothetical protein